MKRFNKFILKDIKMNIYNRKRISIDICKLLNIFRVISKNKDMGEKICEMMDIREQINGLEEKKEVFIGLEVNLGG